jgi:hypothetical protein
MGKFDTIFTGWRHAIIVRSDMKGFTGWRNFSAASIAKAVRLCRVSLCPSCADTPATASRKTPDVANHARIIRRKSKSFATQYGAWKIF